MKHYSTTVYRNRLSTTEEGKKFNKELVMNGNLFDELEKQTLEFKYDDTMIVWESHINLERLTEKEWAKICESYLEDE